MNAKALLGSIGHSGILGPSTIDLRMRSFDPKAPSITPADQTQVDSARAFVTKADITALSDVLDDNLVDLKEMKGIVTYLQANAATISKDFKGTPELNAFAARAALFVESARQDVASSTRLKIAPRTREGWASTLQAFEAVVAQISKGTPSL
jgi:hypothetical protein